MVNRGRSFERQLVGKVAHIYELCASGRQRSGQRSEFERIRTLK
jgi:hypothetical protein